MAEYRDYGGIGAERILQTEIDTVRRNQVYLATHELGDDGEYRRLPFMNRSFISFIYGGKYIESFNLIATVSGDRMERDGYASFSDTTTSYDNLDGQQYWSTHYGKHQFDFHLSTDGIDERELGEFLHWFHPGEARELILAEHPNRAILARVASPPKLSLLPFETEVEMKITGQVHKIKTTLYKGDIDLSLVSDEPFWYAKDNVLGVKSGDGTSFYYIDYWLDPRTNTQVSIFASQDALKMIYEDGIPLGSMIDDNMLLGNGAYADNTGDKSSKVWSIADDNIAWTYNDIEYYSITNGDDIIWTWVQSNVQYYARMRSDGTSYDRWTTDESDSTNVSGKVPPTGAEPSGEGAYINGYANGKNYKGIIAGAIMNADGTGISELLSGENNAGYFYYCGNAPAFTQITFNLVPKYHETSGYIILPRNTHSGSGNPYNKIIVESEDAQELRFTTPNVFTSYNKSIDLINQYIDGAHTRAQVIKYGQEEIRHPAVCAWFVKGINAAEVSDDNITVGAQTTLIEHMQDFFEHNETYLSAVTFTFNSETGQATGTFKYHKNPSDSGYTSMTEDVGDMLRSNHIVIRERNHPNNDGHIKSWKNDNKQLSHRIYHDVEEPLTNFSILYKNMYL